MDYAEQTAGLASQAVARDAVARSTQEKSGKFLQKPLP